MADRKGANELKAGIVILIAIVLVVWLLFSVNKIGDAFLEKTYYLIRFDSVSGLGLGASVTYDGVPMGCVRYIRSREWKDERCVWVGIQFYEGSEEDLEGRLQLHKDDEPRILVDITGVAKLDIKSGAKPERGTTPVNSFSTDPGAKGFDPDTIVKTDDDFLEGASPVQIGEVFGQLQETIASIDVQGIAEDTRTAINDFGALAKKLKETVDTISPDVEKAMASIRSVSGQMDEILKGKRDIIEQVITDAGQISAETRAFIEENRPKLDKSVKNIQELTKNLVADATDVKDVSRT